MYLTIAEDGEVRAWQELSNEDITRFVQLFYIVIKVTTRETTAPIHAYTLDESADLHSVAIKADIDGFLDP